MSPVNCSFFKSCLHILLVLSFVIAMLLGILLNDGLLGGESVNYLVFKSSVHILFIWGCLFHTLFLMLLQCGLLEGEFSELFTFVSSFQALASSCFVMLPLHF